MGQTWLIVAQLEGSNFPEVKRLFSDDDILSGTLMFTAG